eukprot:TRINITY_DN24866_c0_g1_i1.p1 TRINITY_DN24866_c0_g1~~TRINITY_DN24866_c0_g1_i1.p1  ORF type:complete len:157 (+),score=0.05 TRINITY_DN24866_c0_g1_i1:238-708(+)
MPRGAPLAPRVSIPLPLSHSLTHTFIHITLGCSSYQFLGFHLQCGTSVTLVLLTTRDFSFFLHFKSLNGGKLEACILQRYSLLVIIKLAQGKKGTAQQSRTFPLEKRIPIISRWIFRFISQKCAVRMMGLRCLFSSNSESTPVWHPSPPMCRSTPR